MSFESYKMQGYTKEQSSKDIKIMILIMQTSGFTN